MVLPFSGPEARFGVRDCGAIPPGALSFIATTGDPAAFVLTVEVVLSECEGRVSPYKSKWMEPASPKKYEESLP